ELPQPGGRLALLLVDLLEELLLGREGRLARYELGLTAGQRTRLMANARAFRTCLPGGFVELLAARFEARPLLREGVQTADELLPLDIELAVSFRGCLLPPVHPHFRLLQLEL